ncbi:glycosyltransferase [Tolypothrix sp. VBCCA 56010]|uniref:glycosyltransferase n=1 Tax=Tolypothrix sp. VBCCA 56010 TaxID=3137731 RepID=UPI003D7F154A
MQSSFELPIVSVIIPAYNAEVFIEITLKSVRSQTYKNIEVLYHVRLINSNKKTVTLVETFHNLCRDVPRKTSLHHM